MRINQEIAKEIAEKYIQETEEGVRNGDWPPNIYQFHGKHFRPINGFDPEWYKVFNYWNGIVIDRGWKWFKRETCPGFESISDYEYYYKKPFDKIV